MSNLDAKSANDTPVATTAARTRANSYSRKRWSAFDAWQDHVRQSAASVGVAFTHRHDRDLRRAVVSG